MLQAQVDKLLEENKNLSKGNLDLQMFKNELQQKVERLEFQLEGRDNELQEAGQKELEASIRAKQTTEVVDALREHHRIERREVRIKIGQVQTDCADLQNLLRTLHVQLHEQNEQRETMETRVKEHELDLEKERNERNEAQERRKVAEHDRKEYKDQLNSCKQEFGNLQGKIS